MALAAIDCVRRGSAQRARQLGADCRLSGWQRTAWSLGPVAGLVPVFLVLGGLYRRRPAGAGGGLESWWTEIPERDSPEASSGLAAAGLAAVLPSGPSASWCSASSRPALTASSMRVTARRRQAAACPAAVVPDLFAARFLRLGWPSLVALLLVHQPLRQLCAAPAGLLSGRWRCWWGPRSPGRAASGELPRGASVWAAAAPCR